MGQYITDPGASGATSGDGGGDRGSQASPTDLPPGKLCSGIIHAPEADDLVVTSAFETEAGPNLPHSDLNQSDLSRSNLTGADLTGAATSLSCSPLWRLQRAYFQRAGIGAWRHDAVPHYVTNNPALAEAYAAVVVGWLRDGLRQRTDLSAPFNILELGAGSGRFSFYLLRALAALREPAPHSVPAFRYIMSDIAPANLAFWRDHEALAPFVADGTLEFALFDIERDTVLRLDPSGTSLEPGGPANPLLVIANYVFDSIPQDAFAFSNGALVERRIELLAAAPTPDPGAGESPAAVTWAFSDHPAREPPYAEPEFGALLDAYRSVHADGAVLFPAPALRGLRRLADLAGGALTLLSADRGSVHAPACLSQDGAELLLHGSVSLPVNYHAIAAAARAAGGTALASPDSHHSIAILACLPGPVDRFPETRLAFALAIERGGPDEFFTLRRGLAPNYAALEPRHLLALLRLSRWDPKILGDCTPVLLSTLHATDARLREAIAEAVRRCCANRYRLGPDRDWCTATAALLFALGAPAEALQLLEQARHCGEQPMRCDAAEVRLRWNIGLCQAALGRTAEAAASFADAIGRDPDVVFSQGLLA